MSAGVAYGQEQVRQLEVRAVCEVLRNGDKYVDAVLAIVGRMEASVSIIDHYEYLSQGECERPHANMWQDKIQILTEWEEGMPKPPSGKPKLQRQILAAKISEVRKTTRLGSHDEPRFNADGRPTWQGGGGAQRR